MGNLAMARAVSKMACTRAPLPTSAGTGVYERLPGEHSPKHPGKHRKFLPVVEGKGMGDLKKAER